MRMHCINIHNCIRLQTAVALFHEPKRNVQHTNILLHYTGTNQHISRLMDRGANFLSILSNGNNFMKCTVLLLVFDLAYSDLDFLLGSIPLLPLIFYFCGLQYQSVYLHYTEVLPTLRRSNTSPQSMLFFPIQIE